MMRQGLRITLTGMVAVLMTGGCLTASADEIYRWVDNNGVVNFTQQKPRDADSEAIKMEGGTSRVVEDAPVIEPLPSAATGTDLNDEQKKMLEGLQDVERARQHEIAKIKEQNCQQSRDVLGRLTVKSRIRVKEGNDYRVMGEDERQDRIAKAQEGIALYCAPA